MRLEPARRVTRWMRARVRPLALACAIVALLCVAACGGSDSTPAPAPTPVAPTPRLVQQGNFTLEAPTDGGVYFGMASITDASPGTWEATVDWAIPTNTLWMWVSNGACSVEQFSRPECPFQPTCPCQFSVRSETATPKPRVLTIPGAPGGTKTLFVANLGPREEAGTYRVMLTPTSLVANSTSTTVAVSPLSAGGRKVFAR